MMLPALVVTGHVMSARGDEQTASRSHGLARRASHHLPADKRVTETPVVPPRDHQRRCMERLRPFRNPGGGSGCDTVRGVVAEDTRQRLHTGEGDIVLAKCELDQLGAPCRLECVVLFPKPALTLVRWEGAQVRIAVE